jgi:hypothetical protein
MALPVGSAQAEPTRRDGHNAVNTAHAAAEAPLQPELCSDSRSSACPWSAALRVAHGVAP